MRSTAAQSRQLVALVFAFAACSTVPADLVTTRDSLGVRIVESHGQRWATDDAWTIADHPALQIGTLDGDPDYQFFRIVAAVRLPNEHIVVANGGTSQIVAYDRSGTHLWTAGGRGEAPGEYRLITGLATGPGDSLWIYDFGLRRFTILTTTGDVVRTVSIGASLSAPGAIGRLRDGSFLVKEAWSGLAHGQDALGLERLPVAIARFGPDGEGPDTIATVPGREVFLGTEDGRMVMSAPLFGRNTSAAMRAGRLAVGDQETFQIAIHSAQGKLQRLARVPAVDLSISASDVSAMKAARLERESENERAMLARHLDAMDVPPTRPAFGDIMIDPQDYLWVSDYTSYPTVARSWRVFSPNGELLGTIDLPVRFRLLDIGDDFVLGVYRDDSDVEYVQLYALARGATQS